jgi:Gpi18-like mannosyltransferase
MHASLFNTSTPANPLPRIIMRRVTRFYIHNTIFKHPLRLLISQLQYYNIIEIHHLVHNSMMWINCVAYIYMTHQVRCLSKLLFDVIP